MSARPGPAAGAWIDVAPVALALAMFLGLASLQAGRAPIAHEEIASFAAPAATRLVDVGDAQAPLAAFEPTCADVPPPVAARSAVRPVLALCAEGRALPVAVAPYAAGFPLWWTELLRPVHRDQLLRLRWLALALGGAALLLVHRLVRRADGPIAAGCAVLALSVAPSFVHEGATLYVAETLPPVLLLAAGVVLYRRPATSARAAAGGLLVGLALAANAKALLLLGAAGVLALARRREVLAGSRRSVVAFALGAAPPLALVLAGATGDPSSGLVGQVALRLRYAMDVAKLAELPLELLHFAAFGGDLGAYSDLAAGEPPRFTWPGAVVVGLAALVAWREAYLWLRRRARSEALAAVGVVGLAMVLASLLLYVQHPSGNYGPLHTLYGTMVGLAAWAVAGAPGPAASARAASRAYAAAFVGAAPLALGSATMIARAGAIPLSFDAPAVLALDAHLRAAPDAARVVTVTYNLAGVPDAVAGGGVHAVAAHRLFDACKPGASAERLDVAACVEARWPVLFAALPPPVRVVVPLRSGRVDERFAPVLGSSLRDAASWAGLTVVREATFSSAAGVPVLALDRVEPRRALSD